MTFNASSVTPVAIYKTMDIPRQAEPAGTPAKPGGVDGSPTVRLSDVKEYLTLSTSIDGETA